MHDEINKKLNLRLKCGRLGAAVKGLVCVCVRVRVCGGEWGGEVCV